MPLRVVSGMIGLFFLLQGINWILAPTAAAEALGMPLLDGVARSTQIGDIGGFFVALAAMILLGAHGSNGQWLRGAALLLGTAAVLRSFAWLAHGAAFAAVFIGVEVVCTVVLLFAASGFDSAADASAA
jgi:hypothetical protein